MGAIFSYILVAFAVVTLIMFLDVLRGEHYRATFLFAAMSLGSSIWSFFFGILYVQTDTEIAFICRCIGMVGTFGYLIFAVFLIAYFNGSQGKWVKVLQILSLIAIPLYPFLMKRENTIFTRTSFGMTYTFKAGLWNNIYTLYCVMIAVAVLMLTVNMYQNNKRKWYLAFSHKILVCELVIIFGMLLDTIMPLLGQEAFPGSTLVQFLGTVIMYGALMFYESNKVNLKNMSQFVYYSVEAPVMIYDEAGRLKLVNKSAEDFFRFTEDYEHISMDMLFEGDFQLWYFHDEKKSVDARCKVNGAFCRLSINTIWDGYHEVLGYIIIVDDMTDQKENIEELEKARMSAVIANRAKSNFLAQMSHEIRTPLNTVLGMDEMILRESKSEKVLQYADYIKCSGESLLGIINDILDLSKLEEGKMQIYEENYILSDILRDMVNFESMKLKEKGLKFKVDVAKELPFALYGDRMRVKQAVTNVLNNAVKYTDKGMVCLRLRWKEKNICRGELIFEIEDTGRGISREYQHKLFVPYERLREEENREIEGTGLGLAITKDLIQLMGGRIEVSSEEGRGSKFILFIPQRVPEQKEIQELQEEHKRQRVMKDEKYLVAPGTEVLVVDDTESNLVIMQELLQRTQVTVDTASSGKKAIEMAKDKSYDIIFLDHMMPEMDGIETLQRMREEAKDRNGETPVVALTANAILGAKEMYLEAGFDDYLSKPVYAEKLEEMIYKYTIIKINMPGSSVKEQRENGETQRKGRFD